jgi:hypothetical protein
VTPAKPYELSAREQSTARALRALGFGGLAAPCPYPAHRATDWRLPGGSWTCGVCHPPARPGWAKGR